MTDESTELKCPHCEKSFDLEELVVLQKTVGSGFTKSYKRIYVCPHCRTILMIPWFDRKKRSILW